MSIFHQNRSLADAAVEKLRVYAQPQRLMILSCLFEGERTVGEIDSATSIGQPALSQQLAELRRAELVKTRRVAKQVYYDLANDSVRLCVRTMAAIFGEGGDPDSALRAALHPGPPARPAAKPAVGAAQFARIG